MFGFKTVLMSLVALGAMTVSASASDSPVMVIGRAAPGLTVPMHQAAPRHKLIQISTMHRHVVGIMVRDDVVAPDVIHLQMGMQPIYLDPDRNYRRDIGGGIDAGHSIMRAQRAYHAINAEHAYVIRRGELKPISNIGTIMPRAILLRPDYLERRTPQPAPEAAPKPFTPQVKRGPVAMAK